MVLLAWGVNYQTAPLKIREQLVVSSKEIEQLLRSIVSCRAAFEAVWVSTCHRTELYADVKDRDHFLDWITEIFTLKLGSIDLKPYSYCHFDQQAVLHLMRVACGLNSMIVGEVEIFGQIKKSFHLAKAQASIGKYLNRLFQTTFYVAKSVRTKTEIGMNPISIASIAVKLAEKIFTDLKQVTVLLIGAGDLIRLTASHLKWGSVQKMLIANRSLLQAEKLAATVGAEAFGLEFLPSRLHEADIVIAGTSAVLPLVGKGMVEQAITKRRRRPQLMIDLGVPRDIESQVGSLEDVYLYCIDDLKTMVEENQKLRLNAKQAAEQIIMQESEIFMNWYRAQGSLTTLKEFRAKFEQMNEALLAEASVQLQQGKSPEAVLRRYSSLLFNRLLHPPTSRLRKAGFQGEESILQFTRELFELNHEIIHTE